MRLSIVRKFLLVPSVMMCVACVPFTSDELGDVRSSEPLARPIMLTGVFDEDEPDKTTLPTAGSLEELVTNAEEGVPFSTGGVEVCADGPGVVLTDGSFTSPSGNLKLEVVGLLPPGSTYVDSEFLTLEERQLFVFERHLTVDCSRPQQLVLELRVPAMRTTAYWPELLLNYQSGGRGKAVTWPFAMHLCVANDPGPCEPLGELDS